MWNQLVGKRRGKGSQDVGVTRNVTETFLNARSENVQREKKRLESLVLQKQRLSVQEYERQQEKNQSSMLSSASRFTSWMGALHVPGVTGGSSQAAEDAEMEKHATNCAACYDPFRLLVRGKIHCTLCREFFCSNCYGNNRWPLDRITQDMKASTVPVCNRCYGSLTKAQDIRQFRKDRELAEKDEDGVPYIYNIVREIWKVLLAALPEYQSKLRILPITAAVLQEAEKLESTIVSYFSNLKLAIDRLLALKLKRPADALLRDNIKRQILSFFQENMPKFRNMQRRRESLSAELASGLSGPAVVESSMGRATGLVTSGAKKVMSWTRWGGAGNSPADGEHAGNSNDTKNALGIVSVDPLLSPLNGTTIEICGTGFKKGLSVLVDDVGCTEVQFLSPGVITAKTPHRKLDGIASVSVVNPDGERVSLPPILMYSNEFFVARRAESTGVDGKGRGLSGNPVSQGGSRDVRGTSHSSGFDGSIESAIDGDLETFDFSSFAENLTSSASLETLNDHVATPKIASSDRDRPRPSANVDVELSAKIQNNPQNQAKGSSTGRNSTPTLMSVYPAIIPLSGYVVQVEAAHIAPQSQVELIPPSGKAVILPILESIERPEGSRLLKVQFPPMDAGFYSIVISPSKKSGTASCRLENAVGYTGDPELTRELKLPVQKSDAAAAGQSTSRGGLFSNGGNSSIYESANGPTHSRKMDNSISDFGDLAGGFDEISSFSSPTGAGQGGTKVTKLTNSYRSSDLTDILIPQDRQASFKDSKAAAPNTSSVIQSKGYESNPIAASRSGSRW